MTFCAAPFVHMVQNPDGQFRTCCMYEKPLGGKYANIREAFDSEENNIIRQRMLSGEKLPECIKCDIDETHKGKVKKSYRGEFNRLYGEFVKELKFKFLEISVSNKCNFKCIDCGPRFSNQFGPTIENELSSEENFQDIVSLKILGGEPFLDKKNIKLLEMVPRHQIELMVVTNNSIFPNDYTLDLLSEFKLVNLNISIDGIDKIAEYVRFGTKWSRFERNWNKWLDWIHMNRKTRYFCPHFVLHSLNAPFFDETIKWSKIPIVDWSWDFLHTPKWLNASYLPDHIKEYILKKNKNVREPLKKFLYSNELDKKIFKQLLNQNDRHKFVPAESYNVPDVMEDYIDLFYRNLEL